MENMLNPVEQKLTAIIEYAPIGIVEITSTGHIIQLNIAGRQSVTPIITTYQLPQDNFFPVLDKMAPLVLDKIRAYKGGSGPILISEVHCLALPGGDWQYFNFIVTRIFDDCIIISFEDVTEKLERDKRMQQAMTDKAVEQGKLDIAAGVLHDIGNAVVGFGAYLNRIRSVLDKSNAGTLQQLITYLEGEQARLATAIGDDKAKALVALLQGVHLAQKEEKEMIMQAVKEQYNIINHIQEVLSIQRQYVAGQELRERKPVALYTLVNDSLSMLYDSLDKKGVKIQVEVPAGLTNISGDRTRLMQVLLNVLKNSQEAFRDEATDKRIVIRGYALAESLILEIEDNGMGFEPEMAARFFQRGFTTKSSGTGLGLYNCRAIIESHSGSIRISSEGPEKGSLTTIQFINI